MSIHIYASLVPEALIVSMLPPEEFGAYYAVGTMKKAHGQAMFVEVDPAFRSDRFRIDEAIRRIVQSQAPYPAFSPALARQYDVIEIRRSWHFDMAVRLY